MAETRQDLENASETTSDNVIDTPVTDADDASKDDNGDNASEDGNDSETAEKIIIGMVADTKDVFAKYDADGNRSWSDKPPSDLEEAPENETTQKYAIIVRKKKPRRASSTKPLEIDSLIIQSPLLKRALGEILEDYPGITTDVTRLKFHAPFACFVHRWDELEAAMADADRDAPTREHLRLLHRILADELRATIQLRRDYLKSKTVDFEHCWLLFPPGCTVLTELHGQPLAARFDEGDYLDTPCGRFYAVTCSYMDWDGVRVGWVEKEARIPQFPGTAPLARLACYPLEHHPQRAAVERSLRARGRRWEALRGFHYKAYAGVALYSPDQRALTRERVTCRVVVDGARWEDANPSFAVHVAETVHVADPARDAADAVLPPLNHFHVLLASPVVRGYALKNKRWMQFFVDGVGEVDFQDGAFDSLVLSPERKRLILALAESQARHRGAGAFDDVVHGKGRGVIMLLAGGPGIGKTLTAEVVAEQMRVPLYAVSAGDLGSSAGDVDDNLTKLMAMVSNWNAVLLLDECDVFLEARSSADLERNRIVSIFLRTLEYYEGILFLTTNRVADMDAAFASRVHLTLQYPDLDAAARRAIWRTFLDRAAATAVGEDALRLLSEIRLNGRQIKNMMKMAQLLAMQTGPDGRVALEHVQEVLRIQGYTIPEN